MVDKTDPIGYAKYIRRQRGTEDLLRQFLKLETGLGKSDAYKRGHAFSFEWTQEQRDEVNVLMAQGLSFDEAFDKVTNDRADKEMQNVQRDEATEPVRDEREEP